MILPFTTNQWNALRFVAVSIVCVPILERALHKLHQLRAAHRLLSSKPARIRSSNLGNWGLHQEVDELNYRSKVSSILVALLYLGFSLYTEYASGSRQVPRTRIWVAPTSTNTSLQEKPKLYDTNLVGVWPDSGCMSKPSRMAIHNLSEDIVVRKVQGFLSLPPPGTWLEEAKGIAFVGDTSTRLWNGIYDNGTHLLFAVAREGFAIPLFATMDDEKVCISHPDILACYAISENISAVSLFGNLIHFHHVLNRLRTAGTNVLLSNDAFTVEGVDEAHREAWASVARALTRTQFLEVRRRNNYTDFMVRFKYAASATGHICKEEPQIEPKILRIPRNPRPIVDYKRRITSIRLNTTAVCIGLFQKELNMFVETRNSSMVCYEQANWMICARNQSDGTIHLMRILLYANAPHDILWTITFRDQGIRLANLARAAFVSVAILRSVYGMQLLSEETENILQHFEKGMPNSTQVGVSHSVYNEVIREQERATITTWVLIVWVLLFFFGLSFLFYTTMMKTQLLPDVDFLYRRAVMQRHTRFNSVKSIRNPPTVSITKTGKLVELNISYDDVEPGNIASRDLVIER